MTEHLSISCVAAMRRRVVLLLDRSAVGVLKWSVVRESEEVEEGVDLLFGDSYRCFKHMPFDIFTTWRCRQ